MALMAQYLPRQEMKNLKNIFDALIGKSKNEKKIIGTMMLGAASLAMPAAASAIKWNTEIPAGSTTFSCSSGQGNSCTFNNGGEILKARAYSTSKEDGSASSGKRGSASMTNV